MRNGNIPKSFNVSNEVTPCSYPTYEEWKPKDKNGNKVVVASSYPTYEEWKPLNKYSSCTLSVMFLSYL